MKKVFMSIGFFSFFLLSSASGQGWNTLNSSFSEKGIDLFQHNDDIYVITEFNDLVVMSKDGSSYTIVATNIIGIHHKTGVLYVINTSQELMMYENEELLYICDATSFIKSDVGVFYQDQDLIYEYDQASGSSVFIAEEPDEGGVFVIGIMCVYKDQLHAFYQGGAGFYKKLIEGAWELIEYQTENALYIGRVDPTEHRLLLTGTFYNMSSFLNGSQVVEVLGDSLGTKLFSSGNHVPNFSLSGDTIIMANTTETLVVDAEENIISTDLNSVYMINIEDKSIDVITPILGYPSGFSQIDGKVVILGHIGNVTPKIPQEDEDPMVVNLLAWKGDGLFEEVVDTTVLDTTTVSNQNVPIEGIILGNVPYLTINNKTIERVKIEIFSTNGQNVFQDFIQPGEYVEPRFSASAGIYFCRMTNNNQQQYTYRFVRSGG